MQTYVGSINCDNIHMLISILPNLSVSRAVQYLEGKSSHKLLSEFMSPCKRCWGQGLRATGDWIASGGNVADKVWKEYIENQKPPDSDGNLYQLNQTITYSKFLHRLVIGKTSKI